MAISYQHFWEDRAIEELRWKFEPPIKVFLLKSYNFHQNREKTIDLYKIEFILNSILT